MQDIWAFYTGKTCSFHSREQWQPKPWVLTTNSFAFDMQIPRSMYTIPYKWINGKTEKQAKTYE